MFISTSHKALLLVIAFCLSIAFFSCDKIDNPYPENTNPVDTTGSDTTVIYDTVKKILLEDYTGHKCPNCPEAAQIAKDLKNQYGNQLIVIGVHVGSFADPGTPTTAPPGSFTTDFRTTAGEDYNNFFEISSNGLPQGLINRKKFGTNLIIDRYDWNSAVAASIDTPALAAYLKITNEYDAGGRTLECTLQSSFTGSYSDIFKIVALLTEDSIVDWQINGSNYDSAYVHRHVLRGAINSSWGDVLSSGNTIPGKTITVKYTFALNPAWKAEHCDVVAFIYRENTQEIIQVEEEKVIR